ncbi:hypothetical protein ZIOFF_010155 [Zingiber officinale]|uniref:Uncharacterized protein n=1 Tax=Zingiber officinale TaxID=94328 RepID=A0A8J5LRX7_ZINOF|nr:hypothetical protein ZIOFF_010155 [Zingiber officinale]
MASSYRAPKPLVQYTNKIMPTPTPPAASAANLDTISEVDRRAANFISYVQERFRLERMEDDWSNRNEMVSLQIDPKRGIAFGISHNPIDPPELDGL